MLSSFCIYSYVVIFLYILICFSMLVFVTRFWGVHMINTIFAYQSTNVAVSDTMVELFNIFLNHQFNAYFRCYEIEREK